MEKSEIGPWDFHICIYPYHYISFSILYFCFKVQHPQYDMHLKRLKNKQTNSKFDSAYNWI